MATALDTQVPPLDESGTVGEDRRFRPDIQGLRAVAIALVVLFHADIPGLSGGYVGVDVFFVISGFVITGVFVRERETRRRTSILNFYGRRARRIIPAATLVIVVTVIAVFHYLGPLTGHDTAVDGQWAALFLANFHFAASETNYLASQRPPSALQNYWSLAVEEQFYIVYPTLFLLCASVGRRFSLRLRLGVVLGVIIVASYTYSIVLTSSNHAHAFFSPLTRAWELALGALLAVSSDSLRRMPRALAALLGWIGLGRDRGGGDNAHCGQRLPRCARRRSSPRGGPGHRYGRRPTALGCRAPPRSRSFPVPRADLVLLVSVALAPLGHRHTAPRGHRPARGRQPRPGPVRRRAVDPHVLDP